MFYLFFGIVIGMFLKTIGLLPIFIMGILGLGVYATTILAKPLEEDYDEVLHEDE
jgi:hypothetical protein